MGDDDGRLKQLLDGNLSPEELENDPMLTKLAERIYGEDFIEAMGLSRGDAQRALSESLSEEDDDDLLVEIVPSEDLPEIDPFDAPINLPPPPKQPSKGKGRLVSGSALLIISLANLLGGFAFLGGGCNGGGCPSDGHTRFNWASFGNLDSGWGWSSSILDGSYGIPDLILIGIGLGLLALHFLKK
jgi:hypothetical protein